MWMCTTHIYILNGYPSTHSLTHALENTCTCTRIYIYTPHTTHSLTHHMCCACLLAEFFSEGVVARCDREKGRILGCICPCSCNPKHTPACSTYTHAHPLIACTHHTHTHTHTHTVCNFTNWMPWSTCSTVELCKQGVRTRRRNLTSTPPVPELCQERTQNKTCQFLHCRELQLM